MFAVEGRFRRIAGGSCMMGGAALLICAASLSLQGRIWQERHAGLFIGARSPAGRPAGAPQPAQADRPLLRGEALAHLRIPRLGIGTVVVEGTDPESLRLGPGHMEGSALPGEPDNCIIAGHRDGPFSRLRTARPGDIVEIVDSARTTRYRIDSIETVAKEDLRPLAPSTAPVLTLVTCFPFNYVGRAPRRFIVRASLLEVGTEAPVARLDPRTDS